MKNGFYLLALVLITACSKNGTIPAPRPGNNDNNPLLRSIDWDNGTREQMVYGADSTLTRVDYIKGAEVNNSMVFTWNSGRMTKLRDTRTGIENAFTYDASGNVKHMIFTNKQGGLAEEYKFEYTYHADGSPKTLRRYQLLGSSVSLKSSSIYEYHSDHRLKKVVTSEGDITITHEIESWSAPVQFNPQIFLEPNLLESYPVLNFSVLHSVTEFPAKIVRKVKSGSQAEYVDSINEYICEVKDGSIIKMKAVLQLLRVNTTVTRYGVFNY